MKLYLIECDSVNNKRMNLCITNIIAHAKNVCEMYKERNANYKSITDIKALEIMQNDFGCQIVIL